MNILKLYYDAESCAEGFKNFSSYHKYMGKANSKRQTFTYDGCGSIVYFGYAKSLDDCFGKFPGMKFQMINFEYCVMEEVKNYLLTRLRGH